MRYVYDTSLGALQAIASAAGHSILDMMRSTSTYDRSGGQEKVRSALVFLEILPTFFGWQARFGTARLCFKNISKRLFVN